jgi:hypothetical protein
MKSIRLFAVLCASVATLVGCTMGAHGASPVLGQLSESLTQGARPVLPSQLPAALSGLSIGSFNLSRGGIESLQASDETGLRSGIKHLFPHSTFHYAGKLTPTFLSTIQVVVIGVASVINQPITPLTKREQSALLKFIKNGHSAVIFTDNDLQFEAASTSILTPFGLHSTGVVTGDQPATFNPGPDPIESGPAGTASQLDTQYPGWFDVLGASQALATLSANGEPALTYFPAGAISSGSGAVVFFSDSSLMLDGVRTTNDQIAILNALSLTK